VDLRFLSMFCLVKFLPCVLTSVLVFEGFSGVCVCDRDRYICWI